MRKRSVFGRRGIHRTYTGVMNGKSAGVGPATSGVNTIADRESTRPHPDRSRVGRKERRGSRKIPDHASGNTHYPVLTLPVISLYVEPEESRKPKSNKEKGGYRAW